MKAIDFSYAADIEKYIYWNRMGISQLAHFGMRMPINIYSLYLGTYISFEDIKEVDSHDCNISRHLADD